MMTKRLTLFTSRSERIGWITIADNGRVSSNISSSLGDVAIALEQQIKNAISDGLTLRQSVVSGEKIFEVQRLVSSKDESFMSALKDSINRTKFGNQRVFAIFANENH